MSWIRSAVLPGLLAAGLAVVLVGASDDPEPVQLVPRMITAAPAPFEADVEMTSYFPNPDPVVQAVGLAHQVEDDRATDHTGSLRNATELGDAPGVYVLSPNMGRNYGTYELVELIQQVGARFASIGDGWEIEVGDLSLRKGGTIREAGGRRVHSSHRNGLDVDVRYLHRDCKLRGRLDDSSCPIGVRENLELMRMFVEGGPEGEESMVDVMYVGKAFQQRLCRYLRDPQVDEHRFEEVVDKLQVMNGHQVHFHVRIKCPDNSLRCPEPRQYRPDICPRLYAARKH